MLDALDLKIWMIVIGIGTWICLFICTKSVGASYSYLASYALILLVYGF